MVGIHHRVPENAKAFQPRITRITRIRKKGVVHIAGREGNKAVPRLCQPCVRNRSSHRVFCLSRLTQPWHDLLPSPEPSRKEGTLENGMGSGHFLTQSRI